MNICWEIPKSSPFLHSSVLGEGTLGNFGMIVNFVCYPKSLNLYLSQAGACGVQTAEHVYSIDSIVQLGPNSVPHPILHGSNFIKIFESLSPYL